MATAAQMEANRRNARSSTGPKSEGGKLRARYNALKHGMSARTIMPGLTRENPTELEYRIQEWVNDVQPQNAIERELVRQAARLALDIERGERIETQMLDAQRRNQIRELGRRLLYVAGPEEVKVDKQPLWAYDPGLLVSQLEESAQGCRWLLQRWAEFRNLLDRRSTWEEPILIRFIRLQGKQLVESVYDPTLNAIFLAWDVLVKKYAREEWELFRKERPSNDPAYNQRLYWRAITERPSDEAAAWAVLYGVVDQHVGRLTELLTANEASEAAEDPDWPDRAAFDCSPALERHRRSQSAKTRELHRTLDTLRKMRKEEFGTGNGEAGKEDGKGQMANDECQEDGKGQRANDECRMVEDECQKESGGCDEGPNSEPMMEGCSDPVVGQDSHLVLDDATNDKMGILSHEDEDAQAAGQPGQGDCAEKSLACGEKTVQKAANEANLESTQIPFSQGVDSENAGSEARERSQFAAGGQVVHDAGNERVETLCGRISAGKQTRSVGPGAGVEGCFGGEDRKGRTTSTPEGGDEADSGGRRGRGGGLELAARLGPLSSGCARGAPALEW